MRKNAQFRPALEYAKYRLGCLVGAPWIKLVNPGDRMKIWKWLPAALLLVACGSDYTQPTARGRSASLAGGSVTILEGSSISEDNGTLRGSGRVLVDSSLGETRSASGYTLDFALSDGGSFKLLSHSNTALEDALEISFVRDGNALEVTLSAGGQSEDISRAFASVNASSPVKIQVDVHNDESPAHVMVWNRLATQSFTPATALYNSSNGRSPGPGGGARWGFEIDRASVSLGQRTRPSVND